MSKSPPAYQRVPHLAGGRGTADDEVLPQHEAQHLLGRPALVEEKLDGANVAVWLDETGVIRCALRSGLDGMDRGRQLGPLRAWLYERPDALRELLDGRTLYAEWLLTAHSVQYDSLPSYLVGIDLRSKSGFELPDARDRLLALAGLPPPPELYRGTVGGVEALEGLMGRSRAGSEPMEGVVVRSLDGAEPRVAKLLSPEFRRVSDEDWRRGRPRNLLSSVE